MFLKVYQLKYLKLDMTHTALCSHTEGSLGPLQMEFCSVDSMETFIRWDNSKMYWQNGHFELIVKGLIRYQGRERDP